MKPTVELQQQVIWLTGASSGIGEALISALAPCCQQLIISARNQIKLDQLAKPFSNVTALPVDITDLAALQQAAERIDQQFGRVDTLIANAGTCEYVDVKNFEAAMIQRVLDTNFIGLANNVEVALPLLRKSQRGYLVGVSSSVAYLAMPRAQAYGASKAAMTHFLEAMKADLKEEGIDVSVVSPGFVKTPLTDLNDFPMPMRISAEDAAQRIIKGLKKRPWDIHFPKRFTFILKLIASLPAPLRHRITASMARSDDGSASNQPEKENP